MSALDKLNIATRNYIMGVDPDKATAERQRRIDELAASGYDLASATTAIDVADALDPPRSPRATSIVDGIFQSSPLLSRLTSRKPLPGGRSITASITFGKPRGKR